MAGGPVFIAPPCSLWPIILGSLKTEITNEFRNLSSWADSHTDVMEPPWAMITPHPDLHINI